jgi:hypothetical protein
LVQHVTSRLEKFNNSLSGSDSTSRTIVNYLVLARIVLNKYA